MLLLILQCMWIDIFVVHNCSLPFDFLITTKDLVDGALVQRCNLPQYGGDFFFHVKIRKAPRMIQTTTLAVKVLHIELLTIIAFWKFCFIFMLIIMQFLVSLFSYRFSDSFSFSCLNSHFINFSHKIVPEPCHVMKDMLKEKFLQCSYFPVYCSYIPVRCSYFFVYCGYFPVYISDLFPVYNSELL